jgi:YHS domain-containing protein
MNILNGNTLSRNTFNRRHLFALMLLGSSLLGFAPLGVATLPAQAQVSVPAQSIAPVDTERLSGVALSGFDPVAYFSEKRPVEGKSAISLMWQGAEWLFASEGNRALFRAAPERYAPQFGGYCSWAVSQGYTASGDPQAWAIRDGKLYLNYNLEVQQEWEKDIPGNIARGDKHWPTILGRK